MLKKVSKKGKIWASVVSAILLLFVVAMVGFTQGDSGKETGSSEKETTASVVKKESQSSVEKKDEKIKEEPAKVEEDKTVVETEKTETPAVTPTSEVTTKTGETKAATPVTVQPVTKYVNVSTLNVRSGAGTNFSVVTVVAIAQEVTVTGTNGDWSNVTVNGKTGWVSSKYLSDTKPVVQAPVQTQTAPKIASTTPAVQNTAPATQPAAQPATNVADGLKTVGSNQQLILVTTDGYSTSIATIRTFEKDGSGKWNQVLNTTGYVGKLGMTRDMQEGGKQSPIGKFSIGTAFGTAGNPGTKLPWRNITSDDVWVDDSTSPLYNSWQSRSATQGQWNSAENMNVAPYKYGFVINYNTARTPYKGSAIFFHISSGYTLGCTGTSESNVVSILKWLNPSKNPVIIQTPIAELGNY